MLSLPPALMENLNAQKVCIESLDADTVILRQVPVNTDAFNKRQTNVLLKRSAPGLPYLALVDESLSYVGGDPGIQLVFSSTSGRQGWRPLTLPPDADRDATCVLQNVLHVLGFASSGPQFPLHLLNQHGRPVPHPRTPLVGREDQVATVIAALRRTEPCLALILGESGSGKTHLLQTVAAHLTAKPHNRLIVELDLMQFFTAVSDSGRSRSLAELLTEAVESRATIAVEHAEILAMNFEVGRMLLCSMLDRGLKMIGTCTPVGIETFVYPELARRVQVIDLPDVSAVHLRQILSNMRQRWPIEIDESALTACRKATEGVAGCLPATAIALLDAAATFAAAEGARIVAGDDVYAAAGRIWPSTSSENQWS